MINHGDLKPGDTGRPVLYTPTREHGTITSWNDEFIFVRYDMNRRAPPPAPRISSGTHSPSRTLSLASSLVASRTAYPVPTARKKSPSPAVTPPSTSSPSPTRNAMLLAPTASMTTRSNTARQHTLNHDPRTKVLLDELREEGLIGYAISPHRPGEHGPHLEVWKGPSFHDPMLRSEALFSVSDPARALFHQLVSGESEGIVDQTELRPGGTIPGILYGKTCRSDPA